MKRFFLIFFTFLVISGLGGFFFRDQLLTSGTKVFLKRTFQSSVSYRDISSSNGLITIEGFQLTEERFQVTLDSVDFSLAFKKVLTNPKQWLSYTRSPTHSWIGTLALMKQYGMHLNVGNGVLQLEDHRYFFTFKDGERSREIGCLKVSQDPRLMDHPFLRVLFNMRGNQLTAQLQIEEVPSERLLHLAAFAMPRKFGGFVGAQGHVELAASVIFEEDGTINELSTRFACEKFEVHYPKHQLAVRMDGLRGDLNYPEGAVDAGLPVWKQMLCDLTLENGGVVCGKALALTSLDGNLALDPRVDPSLTLNGQLVGQERPLELQLAGKGAIHDDHAYWLEFDLNLNDSAGIECGAFMSICRPDQGSHVVQLEASRLLPSQVEMLKGYFSRSMPRLKEWQVDEGSFGGKLVALFEKGNLAHFEIQDLIGENVTLSKEGKQTAFSKIQGEGRLFEEFNFEVDLTTDSFFGLFSDIAFGEEPAHLSTRVRFEKNHVETVGSVQFIPFHESLQFGFKSGHPFPAGLKEVSEGWARSEKLSEHLYAPFVAYFSRDLDINGDIDLVATFNGKEIDLGMQIGQFHAKHPLVELKSEAVGEKERTEGRAKLTFNLEKETFKGILPLKGGMGYDCTYGVVARNLDGNFSFRNGDFWGEVTSGDFSYDGKPFLEKGSFNLSLGPHFLVQDLKGALPLASDKTFELSVPYLDSSILSAGIYDGEERLLQFDGKKGESWEGELTCKGINGKLAVTGDWDLLNNRFDLDVRGRDLHFEMVKQGSEFLVQELKVGETAWKGLVVPSSEGFTIAHAEMERENVHLTCEGALFIDLPGTETSFGLRCDLLAKGEMRKPIALAFEGKRAAKVAYTPEKGVIVTDLDLETEGGGMRITHLEHLLDSSRTALHNCTFDASQTLTEQLIDANLLPAMMRNFRFSKHMHGVANVLVETGKTTIDATLDKAATWREEGKQALAVKAELVGDNCLLTLREEGELGLTFEASVEEGFEIRSCNGSLGRLSANLKQLGKNQKLKGSLYLDFSLFDQLFELPLSHFIDRWQAGGGYTFDGIFTQNRELKDWGFKGKVMGQGFECAGYHLRSLEARVEALPGQVTIENLDITDDAGKLWIGEGALMKAGSNWVFSFPLVEIRGFQPSFLRKTAGQENPITPLVVKTGSIENLRGRLDDLSTISGEGQLRFVNVSKTGQTLYPKNLPVSVIEAMGLDGAMFVPASGDVDFVIQQGRCYVRNLRNVASLQKRSEFQPPKNGVIGYLDLNGNLFLDLQVKQREVRSLPSITFRVRGNLSEPEITVR